MNREDIEKLWNDQADEYNQWSELDSDEKVEWAIQCFEKGIVAEFEGVRNNGLYDPDAIYCGKSDDLSKRLCIFPIGELHPKEDKKYKIIIKEIDNESK